MSVYRVTSLRPGTQVQVGWSHPAYYWEIFDLRAKLIETHDCVTVYELVDETTGLIDWRSEQGSLAQLVNDPWIEQAAEVGRHGPMDLIADSLRSSVMT